MCRYEKSEYRDHMACFDCRKGFRVANRFSVPEPKRDPPGEPRRATCPQCSGPMADMGPEFQAPRQADKKQWERVRLIHRLGFSFYPCDCCGPGYSEDELLLVFDYIKGKIPRQEGERLVREILARRTEK